MSYEYGNYAAPLPPFVPEDPEQREHSILSPARVVAKTAAIAIGIIGIIGGIFVEPSLFLIGCISLVIGGLLSSNHRGVSHGHHSPRLPFFNWVFSSHTRRATPTSFYPTSAARTSHQHYPILHPIAQLYNALPTDRIGVGDHEAARARPSAPPVPQGGGRIPVGDESVNLQATFAPTDRIPVGRQTRS